MKAPIENLLSPRQQDIYKEMMEEKIPSPDGSMVTPQWVKENYPSTAIQPRRKKKTSPKSNRKVKK